MKKCFCLLLTLLCISYSVMAAPGFRIKGKIVDANNNQPIDFADVLLFVKETLIQYSMLCPTLTVRFVLPM